MFLILAALTFGAIAILFPFFVQASGNANVDDQNADLQVYLSQLDEVERDLARGVVSPDQAEAMRTEIGRRVLAAKAKLQRTALVQTGSTRWLLIALFGCAVLGTAGLYAGMGSFGYLDVPHDARIADLDQQRATRPTQIEAEAISLTQMPAPEPVTPEHLAMVQQLREVVATRPNDLQGLRLLAQQETVLGNYGAARIALENVVSSQGETPEIEDLVRLFDAMLFNANDYISPEAETILNQLRARAPELLIGEFYLGMIEIQNGRYDLAFPIWRDLIAKTPADAPWSEFVRGEMASIAAAAGVSYELPPLPVTTAGPSAADIEAAESMTASDRQAMIETMVDQLSQRLANDGGSGDEWRQLVRALVVLERAEQAKAVFEEALQVFQADPVETDAFMQLGSQMGLN